ncbi:hypothetical protein TNCV_2224351 [Trichonephila clavipes]|nr:hypothetical protein TNCV_2224351 [Trichonephila clavipes]
MPKRRTSKGSQLSTAGNLRISKPMAFKAVQRIRFCENLDPKDFRCLREMNSVAEEILQLMYRSDSELGDILDDEYAAGKSYELRILEG